MNPADDYTYETSGFDSFMSRSIDNVQPVNLDGQAPSSTQVRFDGSQISGPLGDSLRIGGVSINKTNITANDGENDFLLIGDE